MSEMQVIHSDEAPLASGINQSIFLAGPTPRSKDVKSWRPEAVQILRDIGFKGTVCVPERKDWSIKFTYEDQVGWELDCLERCGAIAFWIPRNMETMPALTTNVEFGYWLVKKTYRVFYGRPEEAVSVRYLDYLYKKETGVEHETSLKQLLTQVTHDLNLF